jgi:hypothetical protein
MTYDAENVAADIATLKMQKEINARCRVPRFVSRCSKWRGCGVAHVFCSREAAPRLSRSSFARQSGSRLVGSDDHA